MSRWVRRNAAAFVCVEFIVPPPRGGGSTANDSMHRNVFMVFGLLAIGAIFNLAIAWVCSALNIGAIMLNPNLATPPTSLSQEARDAWTAAYGESVFVNSFDESRTLDPEVVRTSEIYGSMNFWLMETREVGLGIERHRLTDMLRSIAPHMVVIRAGWPLRAFQSEAITEPKGQLGTPRVMTTRQQNGFVVRWPLNGGGGPGSCRIELPYRPIMLGFTVNTILYACMVWMMCAIPIALRRHWRINHCRCITCGYDLRAATQPTCPECGTAILNRDDENAVGVRRSVAFLMT